jgi:hypothetical protein
MIHYVSFPSAAQNSFPAFDMCRLLSHLDIKIKARQSRAIALAACRWERLEADALIKTSAQIKFLAALTAGLE